MTDDQPRIDREGIHIEREVADEVAIEHELDANITAPYTFPSPRRRRIAGWVYVVAAFVTAIAFSGGWVPALGLLAVAGWHFASAWPLAVDEQEALTTAAGAVGFPIGHASASVRFKGWRSRPRWSVVLYSATEPPDQRALVVVDAISGEIVEVPYQEEIAPI